MNKLNEKQIIKIFQNKLGNCNFYSEDVEVFKIGKTNFVIKVDTLVQSTDIPPKMKLRDAARKSIVSPVSDFAAKGANPLFGLVSVTIPGRFSAKNIHEISSGIASAAKEFSIKILGGDTNKGEELVIQVSLFGTADKIVSRKGAKAGDVIVSTGPFGYTAAGLQFLLGNKKASKKFSAKAIRYFVHPKPKLNFGIKNKRYFSSSMDSSDGLSTTLNEMAKQSKKKFVVTKLPINADLSGFAKDQQLKMVFDGGEEFEIVATTSPANLEKLKKSAKLQKIGLYELGFVTKGNGVFYKKNQKLVRVKDRGWVHFRS